MGGANKFIRSIDRTENMAYTKSTYIGKVENSGHRNNNTYTDVKRAI